jgi:hypothetical protein
MAAKKRVEEPEAEPSRAAGGCVLAVLGGVLVAVAFAVDEAAGILLVVVAGAAALYRSARRSKSVQGAANPTPPPRATTPDDEETARRRLKKARAAYDPSGVMCIYHAPAESAAPDPRRNKNTQTERTP